MLVVSSLLSRVGTPLRLKEPIKTSPKAIGGLLISLAFIGCVTAFVPSLQTDLTSLEGKWASRNVGCASTKGFIVSGSEIFEVKDGRETDAHERMQLVSRTGIFNFGTIKLKHQRIIGDVDMGYTTNSIWFWQAETPTLLTRRGQTKEAETLDLVRCTMKRETAQASLRGLIE